MMIKLCELSIGVQCRSVDFWSALNVWLQKPHVVNKRLCGAIETEYTVVQCDEDLCAAVCRLIHISVQDSPQILAFLHPEYHTVPSWSVGSRTIIPKVIKTQDPVHKEIIVKGNLQFSNDGTTS